MISKDNTDYWSGTAEQEKLALIISDEQRTHDQQQLLQCLQQFHLDKVFDGFMTSSLLDNKLQKTLKQKCITLYSNEANHTETKHIIIVKPLH